MAFEKGNAGKSTRQLADNIPYYFVVEIHPLNG
jgi:hypothetical protein